MFDDRSYSVDPDLQKTLAEAFDDHIDFPKPGIVFKDICPVLANAELMRRLVVETAAQAKACGATKIIGIESRGFLLGVPTALELALPFVPARKKGKLPGELLRQTYALEYGEDTVEIQRRAVNSGDRFFVVDDLIATGGTAEATALCLQQAGAEVAGFSFLLELGFLSGAEKLSGAFPRAPVHSIVTV